MFYCKYKWNFLVLELWGSRTMTSFCVSFVSVFTKRMSTHLLPFSDWFCDALVNRPCSPCSEMWACGVWCIFSASLPAILLTTDGGMTMCYYCSDGLIHMLFSCKPHTQPTYLYTTRAFTHLPYTDVRTPPQVQVQIKKIKGNIASKSLILCPSSATSASKL